MEAKGIRPMGASTTPMLGLPTCANNPSSPRRWRSPMGTYTVSTSAPGLDFEFPLTLTSSSADYRICRFALGYTFEDVAVVVYGRPRAFAFDTWLWPGCFDLCPGTLLYFSRDGDIYVSIDPDMILYDPGEYGPNERRLTDNRSVDRGPVPLDYPGDGGLDDQKVAFISERDGQPEIYLMDGDGSDQRRLTTDSGIDGCIAPSPKGDQIAFVSVSSGRQEIHLIDLDGSNLRRLTETEVVATGCPAWSPDARRLAFVSREDAGLFVIGADGSNLRRLTRTDETVLPPGQPTWTETSRIAFGSARSSGTQLVVIDADGSNRANLGETPPWVCPAANGRVIAFSSQYSVERSAAPSGGLAPSELMIDGEGLARRPVARDLAPDACPVWSTVDPVIAYEGADGIYVVGASPRLVAPRGHEPRWSSHWGY